MKYYLIAGEASGDLHASHLMQALKRYDKDASFRFFGGDLMKKEGETLVKHYREMAYMGFIPVLLHLRTIFANMTLCKEDIVLWKPDVVILVDYPGFNLKIASYIHKHTDIPLYYYIAPKLWAWKEYRIKNMRRDIKEIFSILPFEVAFFEGKHHIPIHYVGNPTREEVSLFKEQYKETFSAFSQRNSLEEKPMIAILAGSRKQEIKDNLPLMLKAVAQFPQYQAVIAGAPSIERDYYLRFVKEENTHIVFGQTYSILKHADVALVTSGTATLETALLGVPQIVCYYTPMGKVVAWLKKRFLKVPYISLVNLIAGREVVKELVADKMKVGFIIDELQSILSSMDKKNDLLEGYREVERALGTKKAAEETAMIIVEKLRSEKLE